MVAITARAPMPVDPDKACAVLIECYQDGAAAEALLRAFLCERDSHRPGARFWIKVYELIVKAKRAGRHVSLPPGELTRRAD